MPFTPAHTAIVLPLARMRAWSATGLIIGSMAPDFEYFFKMSVDGKHGHTWGGLFYFDLPVTLVLSLLFHHVVKGNLISNLPVFLQRRFPQALLFDFKTALRKRPVVFLISALAGSVTHILWDAFTHGDGLFVKHLSFYKSIIVPFDGVNYPLWYALQHVSTAVGLSVVALVILLKPSFDTFTIRPSIVYWLTLVVVTGLVVGIRFAIYNADYNLGNVVVSSISGLCIALLVCGLINFRKVPSS